MAAGWSAVSAGPPQESSSRLAQIMLTRRITKRNMARRITERSGKIKGHTGGKDTILDDFPDANLKRQEYHHGQDDGCDNDADGDLPLAAAGRSRRLRLKGANHRKSLDNRADMRSPCQLRGQVVTRTMVRRMFAVAPEGAVGDIVDGAVHRNVGPSSLAAVVNGKFLKRHGAFPSLESIGAVIYW